MMGHLAMLLLTDIILNMNCYSEQKYHHIADYRTPEEKQKHHQFVEQNTRNNLRAFGLSLSSKSKVAYQPRPKQRVELGQGWYCNITDSKERKRHTVLTLHGAPGDHVEWAGLQSQMGGQCRWINLTIPGFDKEDERRGSYDGSVSNLAELIVRLMKKLEIARIVLCSHSLGTFFSSYFIPRHYHLVEGYINITGLVDSWYTGKLTFYEIAIARWGFNKDEWRNQKLYNDDKERQKIHERFLEQAKEKAFGPVEFPQLELPQLMAYTKLVNSFPKGVSYLYRQNRNLQIPRVVFYGKKDPLHQPPLTQACIYNLCHSSFTIQPRFQTVLRAVKGKLQMRLLSEFGVRVEAEKIQHYFCYHLDETGHNAHRRRPVEMSRIIKVYIAFMEVVEQYLLSCPKL